MACVSTCGEVHECVRWRCVCGPWCCWGEGGKFVEIGWILFNKAHGLRLFCSLKSISLPVICCPVEDVPVPSPIIPP